MSKNHGLILSVKGANKAKWQLESCHFSINFMLAIEPKLKTHLE